MENDSIINLLLHGNQLKRATRTGWVQRGIVNAENVAAHSYGVIYTALVLCQLVETSVNIEKVLLMATLHDLPEGLTTDIPSPAWKYLPEGIKLEVERGALASILEDVSFAAQWREAWEELHRAGSVEARLVDDADKLDLFLQALMYEQQTGNRQLEEFWAVPHAFHFPPAQGIYDELRRRRAS